MCHLTSALRFQLKIRGQIISEAFPTAVET